MQNNTGYRNTAYSVNDDDDEEETWEEMETDLESVKCLFCTQEFKTVPLAIIHCSNDHKFDLQTLKMKHSMDFYSFIKLINFIRLNNPKVDDLINQVKPSWNDEKYLKPVVADQWLMYDFEELEDDVKVKELDLIKPKNISQKNNDTDNELQLLRAAVQNFKLQINEKNELLQKAAEDMEKMRKITRNLIDAVEVTPEKKNFKNDDDSYFWSYGHFGIHYEMLSDRVRTESYRNAIWSNGDVFRNKTVIDLGCGTGILSMFAATAGAGQVLAIDQSEIIYQAMDIIRENNLSDKVKLLRGCIEDMTVPLNKVDIIVSEWMGYFLMFEGMLDSLVYTRDRYLAPGGLLIPSRCNISIVGGGDIERHNNLITFWENVYGYRMSCMKNEMIKEANIEVVPVDKIITTSAVVKDVDLYTCTKSSINFDSSFTLIATSKGLLTSIVGYFDTFFELPNPIEFSTGPHAAPTHWKQTVFYLQEPIIVQKGQSINGHLHCRRNVKDARAIQIEITIGETKHLYSVC